MRRIICALTQYRGYRDAYAGCTEGSRETPPDSIKAKDVAT